MTHLSERTGMEFNDLTDEQKEKIRNCKTPEDILALAQEEGYELSSEELETVSGGDIKWDCCDNKSGKGYIY